MSERKLYGPAQPSEWAFPGLDSGCKVNEQIARAIVEHGSIRDCKERFNPHVRPAYGGFPTAKKAP